MCAHQWRPVGVDQVVADGVVWWDQDEEVVEARECEACGLVQVCVLALARGEQERVEPVAEE